MKKIKIVCVAGARPNFVKIAPFIRELKKHKQITNILVHTGQHYTDYMSGIFMRDFRLSKYIALNVGPASVVKQMAKIMQRFERVLLKENPDLVVVVGDVNSTLACALTAVKLNIRVAHIEAGLRSFDRTMTEEINRVLTDAISDYLFITEPSALKNLRREGIAREKIFFVGNIMIDSLVSNIKEAKKRRTIQKLSLKKKQYAILTLHRPSNVDDEKQLKEIINLLGGIQRIIRVVYPIHPRTVKMLKHFGYLKKLQALPNLLLIKPLSYLDFLSLTLGAKFVITDSGGIQEETTYLGTPCFTLRKNTERPITVIRGTNTIIGNNYGRLIMMIKRLPNKTTVKRLKFWDGKAAVRIVSILKKILKKEIDWKNEDI